ncbi:signal peptidase I [Dysosmobacter sp.]|uniref:signal peptidase I n=1 Tax=Dysosmobacter sp. TaxID=2591382 RepID=UPI003AF1D4C3
MKKAIKKHRTICIVAGVCIVILLSLLLSGLRLCVIQSGSMEPTIPTYSVCLVTTQVDYDDLSAGDIVVYTRQSDGQQIVHRVVDITDTGAITRGDANQTDDGVSVTPDNLYAQYIAHIPCGGRVINAIRTPTGCAIIVTIVAILIAWNIIEDKRRGRA